MRYNGLSRERFGARGVLAAICCLVLPAVAAVALCAGALCAETNNVIAPTRYFPVADPLFEDLFSDEARPIKDSAAFVWAFMFENTNPPMTRPRVVALQHGVPYSHDEFGLEFGRLGINLFGYEPGTNNWAPVMDGVRARYDIRGILAYHLQSAGVETTPKVPKGKHRGRKIFMDPANLQGYLDRLPARLKRNPDWWWGVTIGDEPFAYSKGAFYGFLECKDELDYPYIDQALAEIKNKYGYGKFGVPSSLKAANEPFQWIAFNRWLNDKFAEAQKKLYTKVKEVDPSLYMIGEDSVSHTRAYGYSRYGDWVDIATGQQRPGKHRHRQYLAYKAKLIHDLTGKEVWLAPHIEHFIGSFSADEIHNYVSEIVRAGGTGFQLWPGDPVGGRGKMNHTWFDGVGAPERWKTIMNAVSYLRAMPKLKFPRPDAAIFFSNDSGCSRDRAVYFQQYEGAFTFLGPLARAWFEFVSDLQILDGKKKLADYKVVVVPFATYQRKEIPPRFLDYVKGGGTLLCADPQVFRWHLDGTETPGFARDIFGVTSRAVRAWPKEVVLSANAVWPGVKEGRRMPVIKPRLAGGESEGAELETAPGAAFVFRVGLDPDALVLGKFPDGAPAIVMKTHGKGRAIYFAFNPFYRDYFVGPHDTDYAFFKEGKREVASLDKGWLFKHDPLGVGERDGWHEAAFDRSSWSPGAVGMTWENEAARLKLGRRELMNLTPQWLFATDPDQKGVAEGWFKQGFDRKGWMKASAGRNWQEFKKGYYGTAWYAKSFALPEDAKGKTLDLFLPGVDEDCWIYLNEKEVFSRVAKPLGSLWDRPIRVAVSDALRYGKENLLVVRVHKTAYQTGIYKEVLLVEKVGKDAGEEMEFGKRYSGNAWYANTFELSADDVRDRSVYVHFQGVRNAALVCINGKVCGHFAAWNVPFAVDVTDAVREGNNLLAVRVTNQRRRGGISGAVRVFTGARGEPAVDRRAGYPVWEPVMRDLFEGLGIKTGQDIWRFMFPGPNLARTPVTDLCLTGNYFRWENYQVLTDGLNEKVEGRSYGYSVAPDDVKESCGKSTGIAFAEGDLTDRLSSPWVGSVISRSARMSQFVVRWKTKAPVEIDFDLGKVRTVSRVGVVYTSQMPELVVSVSTDGKTYSPAARDPGRAVTHAVPRMELPVGPVSARYVRLSFGERPSGSLYLSEVDIWGK